MHSPGLVAEVHSISLRMLQAEDHRESRLDAKAQGLLITAGLTLTVAFTFGGMTLEHPDYLRALGDRVGVACLAAYPLALVLGLLSSIQAVRALRVSKGYRHVGEVDVFNRFELKAADDSCADLAVAADNLKAVAMYQRYMASVYPSVPT